MTQQEKFMALFVASVATIAAGLQTQSFALCLITFNSTLLVFMGFSLT